MKCEVCKGTGYVPTVKNNSDFFMNGDSPVVDYHPCEECDQSERIELWHKWLELEELFTRLKSVIQNGMPEEEADKALNTFLLNHNKFALKFNSLVKDTIVYLKSEEYLKSMMRTGRLL